ncbi:MAG: hypothetical protein CMG64_06195 [Candidatus Marinimicrobia bacterium]|nr:hypothetical protein [Candidatus Neomarinimicrobiota bacterium]
MSNYKNVLIYILLFTSFAFTNYSIKGTVYDEKTKETLIGASVFIEESNQGTATNIDGMYILENVERKLTAKIKVSYIGYEIFEKLIKWSSSDVNNVILLDVYLKSSNVEVDETLVTSQRRQDKVTDAPAAIEIISASDIKRESSTNLGSYLKGIKGVDYTASGINNYSISVRGFNSSFTTRLLTLTDGRVAAIPALRVINYSLIPQSSKDVESIEVVLGPSTALYGANAHSGVVSINSKSPADSEGFDVSLSGSINDARDLYKFDTRYAKKINRNLSFKFSGSYVQANEWEFVSEEEYKLHTYPYSGFSDRTYDKKDNNPWISNLTTPDTDTTASGEVVWIGDGEKYSELDINYDNDYGRMTEDECLSINNAVWYENGNDGLGSCGDGASGEDWFNNHDDDGDGLIDENYFAADGIDNDGNCPGDTNLDGCYCCGWLDKNGNKKWDDGEDLGGDDYVDEYIDVPYDQWFDGKDNDGNGLIDDNQEMYTGSTYISNWQDNLENNNIIVFNGRQFSEINGIYNPWYTEDGVDKHIKGDHYYDEHEVKMMFDVYMYDFGNDQIPGDNSWIDEFGNQLWDGPTEGNNTLNNVLIPSESCIDLNFSGTCGDAADIWLDIFDNGLDGIPGTNDYGESDGIWTSFDWDYGSISEAECQEIGGVYYSSNQLCGNGLHTGGDDWNSSLWTDTNNDNFPDFEEIGDNNWQDTYPYINNIWDSADEFTDSNGDGIWNVGEILITDNNNNGIWDDAEQLLDCGQDGLCDGDAGYPGPDFGENDGILVYIDNNEFDGYYDPGDGCFNCDGDEYIDTNENGRYDLNEPYTDNDNNNMYTPPDYKDNFEFSSDVNGDGLSEYPDFEVKNSKVEFRLDYDPSRNLNLSFQTGYSKSKTQQVTGFGRYLTDGYVYKYYQLRGRYKNWFSQIYVNQGNSGNTRGYLLGNVIDDQSSNMAFQIQNNFKTKDGNTKIVWGIDYFKTMAKTNGSILNDGPNGYDNDGDNWYTKNNNIDDDRDSDDYADLNGNGKPDPGEPGVNGSGFVYQDGIDNDGDSFDNDGDGYINFIEEHFGTDPESASSSPITSEQDWTAFNPFYDLNNNGVYENNEPGYYDTNQNGIIDINDSGVYPVEIDPYWYQLATDEMIDEIWCGDEQYQIFVTPENLTGFRDGRRFECYEGVDEPDEFLDVTSDEMGFYFQSKTNPFGNKKWEFIAAARLDHHSQLDEDIQFSPKFGIFYKPNDFATFRLTYGKAYNTPSAITLYTDLFVQNVGGIDYYLRGNKDGTPYQRVGEEFQVSPPQIEINNEFYYLGAATYNNTGTFLANDEDYWDTYINRTDGAPYFYAFDTDFISTPDFIPLDTAIYTIWVPELNDTGRIYTPLEALNVPDVEPIKTEKIQTIEFGFKGFLTERLHATFDYYSSFYEDFFSAPTVITPLIIERQFNGTEDITNMDNINVVGLLPVNDFLSNPPYGTQWDGVDNDNDWSSNLAFPFFSNNSSQGFQVYGSGFEIDFDNPIYNISNVITNNNIDLGPGFDWSLSEGFNWAEDESFQGEWGYVDYIRCGGQWNSGYTDIDIQQYCDNKNLGAGDTLGITIYHPEHAVDISNVVNNGTIGFGNNFTQAQFWGAVGVDEYDPLAGGPAEAEILNSPIVGVDGQQLQTPGFAYTPLHSVLAPLNYGKVNMQGIDIGLSYLFPEYNFVIDGNFSFYNSTEYYNKLTKKNDPINAPKFKMNGSITWQTKYGDIGLKYRHVDRYLWKDGIWSGYIGPYDLIDLLYSYRFNENLELNLTAQNIFDDVHKELIGGAFMGRQIIIRLGASI